MKKKNFKRKNKKTRSLFKKSKFKFNSNEIKLDRLNNLGKDINESVAGRTVNNAGVVKQSNEFMFPDGGSVEVGTPYHIHYSPVEKKEIYMTDKKHNDTSLPIVRLMGSTNFGKYVEVKNIQNGMKYLSEHKFKVTKKHRKIGNTVRYFAQESNNSLSSVFEISKNDYNINTPFYKKVKMEWSLDLNNEIMINKNIDEMNKIVKQGFSSLEYSLNPSEGYIGGNKSPREEQLERLSKLLPKQKFKSPKKKRRKKKKNLFKKGKFTTSTIAKSTSTDTSSDPPSGWSAGDGPPPGSGY